MLLSHVEDTANEAEAEIQIVKKDSSEITDNNELNEMLAKFVNITEESKEGENKERAMSLKEGLKMYPKACFWSVVACSTLIMEGYDMNLINSFYSFPTFNEKFGEYYEDLGEYQVPAQWQTALSISIYAGELLGLFIAGSLADRFGYRWTLIGALVAVTGLIFIVFFAVNIEMLLAGEILLGIPWGFFQTLCVTYASDICPMALRLYLTTYANACWVIGQLISSGILRGMLESNIEDSYRIPFALQWFWPIPIAIGVYFGPESPWWLARKEKNKRAKHDIKRLLSHKDERVKDILAEQLLHRIKITLEEEDIAAKGTGYLECFKGDQLRRTLITAMIWVIQSCTGSSLMGYSTYFYTQAGLDTSMSFTFSIIQYALGLLGTLASWILSQKLGRFTLFFGGVVCSCLIMLATGFAGIPTDSESASWAAGSFLLIFTTVYDATVGPICYCMVTEIPSARLKAKSVVIARNAYNLSGIVVNIITPYMLNPTAWNWGAKTGFFWSGLAFIAAILCWFFLPETKGRTYAEMDALFDQKISARKFKNTEVEVFNAQKLLDKMDNGRLEKLVKEDENYDNESQIDTEAVIIQNDEKK